MAFKMKGFPKLSGIGGVQAEKDLQKELKSMATGKSKANTEEPTMSYEEFAKKTPGTARYLTKEQYEAKIKKLKSGFKKKGTKFYGDRTRKEMRQDIKEHRKSLGGDKEAIKADRKYQRGSKKELRGEELIRRGKTKRGQKKFDAGRKITDQFR